MKNQSIVCRERFLIGGDAEPTDLKTSYTVDERGWGTTSVAKEWEEQWKTYTSTFTYADIDEYGNWHKANEKNYFFDIHLRDKSVVIDLGESGAYWLWGCSVRLVK